MQGCRAGCVPPGRVRPVLRRQPMGRASIRPAQRNDERSAELWRALDIVGRGLKLRATTNRGRQRQGARLNTLPVASGQFVDLDEGDAGGCSDAVDDRGVDVGRERLHSGGIFRAGGKRAGPGGGLVGGGGGGPVVVLGDLGVATVEGELGVGQRGGNTLARLGGPDRSRALGAKVRRDFPSRWGSGSSGAADGCCRRL